MVCFLLNLSNMQESNGKASYLGLPMFGKQEKRDWLHFLHFFLSAPKKSKVLFKVKIFKLVFFVEEAKLQIFYTFLSSKRGRWEAC